MVEYIKAFSDINGKFDAVVAQVIAGAAGAQDAFRETLPNVDLTKVIPSLTKILGATLSDDAMDNIKQALHDLIEDPDSILMVEATKDIGNRLALAAAYRSANVDEATYDAYLDSALELEAPINETLDGLGIPAFTAVSVYVGHLHPLQQFDLAQCLENHIEGKGKLGAKTSAAYLPMVQAIMGHEELTEQRDRVVGKLQSSIPTLENQVGETPKQQRLFDFV